MANEITVTALRQIPAIDPARVGRIDTLVSVDVEALGPMLLRIPADPVTPAQIQAAVRERVGHAKGLVGKKLDL